MAAAAEWKRKIRERMLTRTTGEWLRDFDAAGVPVSAAHLPEEMADQPQVLADGMIWELEHSVTGPQRVAGPILKMSKTPPSAVRAAPALGEHTAELLQEMGLAVEEISALHLDGVLFSS